MLEMPIVGTFWEDFGSELGIALLVAIILAAGGLGWRKWGLAHWRAQRSRRAFEKAAPFIVQTQLGYVTHLRDNVMDAFWRAREEPSPEQVRERIRRHILEPIRGFLPTQPGEEIKVVWFRPDSEAKYLRMYEQVGHSEEGQAHLRLRIGAGLAGRAFNNAESVMSSDVDNDERFQAIEKGKATGSLACVPIVRAGEVTGVLSVMSNCQDAFWVTEQRYFEALAAAIAAIEPLEQQGGSADTSKQSRV